MYGLPAVHSGQHSPGGVTRLWPSRHSGLAQSTAEQSGGGQTAQHSPSGTIGSEPSGQVKIARQSTAAQSGLVHTGQHSPGGVSKSSQSNGGQRTREQ